MLIKITTAHHNFTGTQASLTVSRHMQSPIKDPADIGTTYPVSSGIEPFTIIIGGKAIELCSNSELQAAKVEIKCIGNLFNTPSPSLYLL